MVDAIPLPEKSASTLEQETQAARREATVLRGACAIYQATNEALTAAVSSAADTINAANAVIAEQQDQINALRSHVLALALLVDALTGEPEPG
jgi:hypothetical protein